MAERAYQTGTESVKADSVRTCLERVHAAITKLDDLETQFRSVATSVGGGWPEQGNELKATVNPDPTHILFVAHGVEERLTSTIGRLESTLKNLAQYVG